MSNYPIEAVRKLFPALNRKHNKHNAVYFDGPGGSQVVENAINAMTNYMRSGVANLHGQFPTSEETDAEILKAKEALGAMLNVSGSEIAFGANATSLMFAVSRAAAKSWQAGDEIVVSELDHRSNVDSWISAAQEKGVIVRWIPVNTKTYTLELDKLDEIINSKTKLVAVGYASNAVGTINDIQLIAKRAHAVKAIMAVDAVHIAPHIAIDMQKLEADMLFCSVYKCFGGHIGVAAIRKPIFDILDTYRLKPAPATAPGKLETGTQSHEAIFSIVPAIEFVASLGQGASFREKITSGFQAIEAYENSLADHIRKALEKMPKITMYQSPAGSPKTATIAFTVQGYTPVQVCRKVCDEYGIFIADGDFYATTLADKLDINKNGAWVRAGLAPYNTIEEADLFIKAISSL